MARMGDSVKHFLLGNPAGRLGSGAGQVVAAHELITDPHQVQDLAIVFCGGRPVGCARVVGS